VSQAANYYRCPCCGAALTFSSRSQQLECANCGNTFPLESLEQAAQIDVQNTTDEQMHWEFSSASAFAPEEESHLRTYRCQNCGSEIVADETTAATECVYCGSPSILPGVLSGAYRPDGVIPFQKSKKEAMEALKNHCKGKKLLPNGFMDDNRIEKITGVYEPFWLFQADGEGDCTFNATRVSVHREGQFEVIRTAHFLVRRGGGMQFNQVPVDGSTKMDDTLMESIEPYDNGQAQDFNVAYLSGYQAQRHDREAEECQARANERIRESVLSVLRDTVMGYSTVTPVNTQVQLRHGQVRQVLLPVWLLNTRWQDQTYTFAMNGQTGQFVGDLPTDKGKFWRYLLGITLGVAAGGYAIAYLLFTMGVL